MGVLNPTWFWWTISGIAFVSFLYFVYLIWKADYEDDD